MSSSVLLTYHFIKAGEVPLGVAAVLVAEGLVILLYVVEIGVDIGLLVCLDKTARNV